MIVPFKELSPDTLDALIEEFVTRDGAVHGHRDDSMEAMLASVRKQLAAGVVVIVYDEEDESCSIVPKEALKRD